MTAHERALDLGAASVDFRLSAAEREDLDRHLATCAQCRSDLDGMASDTRRLESRPAHRMPAARAAAVRASLEGSGRGFSPAMILVTAVLLLLAAAAVATVGSQVVRRLDLPRLAVEPFASGAPPASVVPSPASTPAAPASWALAWTPVDEPDIRPTRGFEHSFLDSARGTMIQIRYLEGAPTTIVATTRDGVTWTTDEVSSDAVPAGQAVNGGADWMQLVERADGRLALFASADGFTWQRRSVLPETVQHVWESAVNGDSMLVCGAGRGLREGRAECAHSADGGLTWSHLANLGVAIDMSAIRGIVPLGEGFVVIVEGFDPGESVAWTSSDGVEWTRQPQPVPNRATAVGVLGDTVVVFGATGTEAATSIAATRDGVTWETVATPAPGGMAHAFVRAGDLLVAPLTWVPAEGAELVSGFMVSADGRAWTPVEAPAEMADWQSPTFLPADGAIIALGSEPGAILLGTVAAADAP